MSEQTLTFTLPVPIGETVYVISQRSVCDWYTEYFINDFEVEGYVINQRGLSKPCYLDYRNLRPVTNYTASDKYFTDYAEAEKELERVRAEDAKGEW